MTILSSKNELQQGLQTILLLQQQGQTNKAIELSQSLLVSFPKNVDLLHNLGVLYLYMHQPAKSLEYLKQAIAQQPNALSYNFAGVALCQMGQIDEGITYYKKALNYKHNLKESLFNLGIAFFEKNELLKAEKYLKKAHAAQFVSPILFYNLGLIEHQRRNFVQAIEYYQKALTLDANHMKCMINLGEAYFESNRHEEAFTIFLELVKQLPEDKNLHKKLGVCYINLKKNDEGLLHLKKGFNPEEEDGYIYLSKAYNQLKDYLNKYRVLVQAIKKFPDSPYLLMSLIHLSRTYSIWHDLDYFINHLKSIITNEDYHFRYSWYYILNLSLQEELILARKMAKYYNNKVSSLKHQCKFKFKRKAKPIIKIGYISGSVRLHPNAQMIMDLFSHHSRERFDYSLYSTAATDDSIYAQKIMSTVDHFVDVKNLPAVKAAQKIYQDGIDILVDLSGYFNRLSSTVLSLKPAGIIIGFLDHCGTRGADYIDYILTDYTVTHLEEEKYYDEKLIFLPDTIFIASNQQIIAPKKTRQDYNLPTDKFIFTCFNSNLKLEPNSFASWMRILSKVPNAVLLLWCTDKLSQENIKNYVKEYNIDPERILFAKTEEKSVHIARLQLMDLFLDCFDCSAHCTAIDALWAGLPMVTLYGNTVARRGGSSILKAHGMQELITYSISEYEEKAVALANNPELLHLIKEKIIANQTTEPLFNTELFARNLESAYLKVYEHYLTGAAPEHILKFLYLFSELTAIVPTPACVPPKRQAKPGVFELPPLPREKVYLIQ